MFIRTSRLQLGNFAINDAKRLLQQYRPITTDMALEPNVGFRGTAEVAGALRGCESIVSPQIFLFIY
jgi:hypothetical protein